MIQKLATGLSIGGAYAIFALGYTLVFSILRVVNFAHGAVFAVGAYLAYALTGSTFGTNGALDQAGLPFGLPFPLALLGGALGAGLFSVLVERIAFRPLRKRGSDPLLALVSSLGVAIATVNLIQYLVGAESYPFPSTWRGSLPAAVNLGSASSPVPVRTIQVVMFVVSMALVVALTWFVNRTRRGKALQAVSEDPTTAQLLGIDVDRLVALTFFLSGFLGGVAGTLLGVSVSIAPYIGINFGLKGLAVLVLGGLGDIPGAVVGGIVLGLAESLVPSSAIAYKEGVAFAVLLLVLLLRPRGLLGRGSIEKV
ncbi:MAG: branched-chain amino acid ABC transporter permease [Acidimicrobiia bacterium]